MQLHNNALTLEEIQAVQNIGGGSEKGPGIFSEYDLVEGYVDTGSWMGWVYVGQYPWCYLVDLSKYVFVSESAGWVYIPK